MATVLYICGMKILVIRFSSIGDIVLTTPVLRCIKLQLPHAIIHYAVKAAYSDIVAYNPYVTKVLEHTGNDDAFIAAAKAEQYDLIIDLHHNLRTLKIKKALRVPSHSYNKLNMRKWLLTALRLNVMPSLHIVDRYMHTVSSLGVYNDGLGLNFMVPELYKLKPSDLPTAHLAGYVTIVVGAAHATKALPLQKLVQLCSLVQHPIILLGGKAEYQAGKAIAAQEPYKIYNACGKFSLLESADIIKGSKLVVTPDTGMMHIAAAYQKPIISIWGSTVPALGMTPYYGHYQVKSAIIQAQNVQCQPCSKIGYSSCPKGHFKCMENISMPALAATVHEFLGIKPKV